MPRDGTDLLPQQPDNIGGTQRAPERNPAQFLPYFDHVSPNVVVLKDGGLMAMLRMEGVPFHLASNGARNGSDGRHFALLQLLADKRTEIHEHYVSHRHVPAFDGGPAHGTRYEREWARRYDRSVLSGIRTREWFFTIIVRPQRFSDGWFTAAWRRARGEDPWADDVASAVLEAKVRTALAALARFGARRLGQYEFNGFVYSEIAEALVLIRTLRKTRVAMWSEPGSFGEAVYTDRVIHGSLGFMIRRNGGETFATYGRMYGLNPYPKKPRVGMFDGLLTVDADIVVSNCAQPISRAKATDKLELTLARMQSAEGRAVTDREELEAALNELASAQEVRAEHGWSLAVHADSMRELDVSASEVADIVSSGGCVPVAEGLIGGEAAYWSQWPGNMKFRTRPATIGLRRFAHLSSLEGFPSGTAKKPRWGAPLLRFATAGGTYYDHDLHDGQVGHTLFCGPIGSGKTVAEGVLTTAATRIIGPDGRVILLDKDNSNKLTVLANDGCYVDLKKGEPSGMAPLRRYKNTAADRETATDLILGMIRSDGGTVVPGPAIAARIAKGVAFALRQPPEKRSLGLVHAFLPPSDPSDAAARLRLWCWGQAKGWAFDAPGPDLIDFEGSRVVGVDVTALLNDEQVLPIAAAYLLNAAGRVMHGRRVIFIVEEGKFLLPKPYLAKPFEDTILTGRKKNVAFWFVTQQPEHILAHEIGSSVLAQLRTRFLFKNELADRAAYCGGGRWGDGLHCTPQEFMQIREGMTVGAHSVLIQRPGFSTLCRFDLSGMPEDIAILSGNPKTVALYDRIASERGTADASDVMPEFLSRLEEAAA